MGYSQSAKGAVLSYFGWFIAGLISPAIPDGLGALVSVASIFASATDIGESTGPALLGAFITGFLAYIFQDQVTMWLAVIAIIVGLLSIYERYLK